MRFLYFITISTFFISCSSIPKEFITNDNTCQYNDPIFKITKEEMVFNVEKYNEELEKGYLVLINNKSLKNKYYRWKNNGDITNKQTYKHINIQKLIKYDRNGRIFFSNFKYLNASLEIGKETEYNQQGKITKVIDYEKGYKICWTEAIEIVKRIAKKDINKFEIKEFYLSRNDLNEFPTAKPIWTVGLMNGNEKFSNQIDKKGKIRYVIDGVTGKLIKTFRVTIE